MKDSRVDPSDESHESIRYASMNGHIEVVALLMRDSRVDPSAERNASIRHASRNGYYKIVEYEANTITSPMTSLIFPVCLNSFPVFLYNISSLNPKLIVNQFFYSLYVNK